MLQVVTQPPNTGIGFSQLKYEIEVMENTPQEAVLHTLTLRQGHTCVIASDNKVIRSCKFLPNLAPIELKNHAYPVRKSENVTDDAIA